MTITLEDLRGRSPALCGHFNKIIEEVIRVVGENENEVEKLLTQMILMEFVQFHMKKRKQYLEKHVEKKKRVVLKIIPPKKPLQSAPNNSENVIQNQEKEEEEKEMSRNKRQRKNPTKIKQAVPDQPPCMPTLFKDRIMWLQGSNIKFVIQKVVMVMVIMRM
jgi:phosphoribosylanthranilate isomerase